MDALLPGQVNMMHTQSSAVWLISYFRLQLVFGISQLERSQLFSYPVIILSPQGFSQTSSTAFPPLSSSQHVICSALRCPHHTAACTHIRHVIPVPWTPAAHHLTQFMVSHSRGNNYTAHTRVPVKTA